MSTPADEEPGTAGAAESPTANGYGNDTGFAEAAEEADDTTPDTTDETTGGTTAG